MLQTKWWRIAAVTGLGLLAGAAAGRAAGERPPTYVWLFSATGEGAESLTESVTEEFEEALVKAGCLPIVERRNLPDLQSHQKQEERIEGADSLSPRQRRLLSTASAEAVVFGKLTDDIEGGQVKIAVTLETLSGVTLANTSVRIIRGKRFDAEERERRMADLASEVCNALGLTRSDSGSSGDHGSSQGRRESPAPNEKLVSDFRFDLRGCRAEGSNIVCSFVVTNLQGDRNFELSFRSGMIDSAGESHQAERIFAGRELRASNADIPLVTGVPTAFSFRFVGLAASVRNIALLEVKSKEFSVQWRNIKVQ